MQDDRFWLLVSLKLSGEATQEDLAALEAHLQAHPEIGLKLETLYNLWQGPAPASSPRRSGALSRHLQRLSNHLSEPALKYELPVERRVADETTGSPEPSADPEESQKIYPVYRWLWPASGIARRAWTT